MRNLCLAGGVALNCVANGKVLRDGMFEHIWIQPAAGDAGGALGAALAAYHLYQGQPRPSATAARRHGRALSRPELSRRPISSSACTPPARSSTVMADDDDDRADRATRWPSGKAVGWFQGRMEFGPRALGARSILGDPRSPDMQKMLNLKVKYRESFRPFAPSVLREDVADWFELDGDSPYMLLVADVAQGAPPRR